MEMQERIPIDIFCRQHGVETSVIFSFREFGLLEVFTIDELDYIDHQQLELAEKLVRLYADLHVNLEGIDVINHLLERINEMGQTIIVLKNRLRLYEDVI
ncbi:MAG: chaperone modulator CbpM [Chitinophagaceae bacterium]|nr:chaperone modulator CbpM [Chitinophagaceae bacterium]